MGFYMWYNGMIGDMAMILDLSLFEWTILLGLLLLLLLAVIIVWIDLIKTRRFYALKKKNIRHIKHKREKKVPHGSTRSIK